MTGYYMRIMGILEPKVGHTLARSVIIAKCADLGITPESISADTLTALANELYDPLRVFGGEAFAKSLTTEIQKIVV